MNAARCKFWGCIAALVAMNVAGRAATEAELAAPSLTNGSGAPPRKSIPSLPPRTSPVAFFRELLAMTPAQRQGVLASRPTESQKTIQAKIQEYEALTPEQRELRLRVTELRYYLLPLMSSRPNEREPLLKDIPTELRPLVDQRLRRWDELPPEKQKELLDNENWLRQVAEFSRNSPTEQQLALTNMPATQRQALEAAVRKWQAFGADRREEVVQRFEEYFGLTAPERTKILLGFSDKERQLMQKTLQSFDKLSPEKRGQCVRALDKLARLTPEQRDEFLKSAERWQALSPAERKAWRTLVFNLTLPPAPRVPPPPLPAPKVQRPATAMVTN